MALDGISPALAIRSSVGIEIWNSPGFKQPYVPNERFTKDESKNCRTMTFSPDGQYFAYSNGTTLKVINTSDWKEKCTFPRPKAFYLKFSPRGNYLVTWELFMTTKDNTEGSPNMYVYKVETGEEMFSTIQKKQTDWEPCWSNDESLFGLMVGGEALFYELNGSDDFKSSAKKLGGGRNGSLSISPGGTPPFIVFYVPGTKGSPSMCKLYKYPALQQSQTVGCKSFFQADRVEMLWNKRGTGLLLLTSTEVDQTGASYYGKQALHFMSTKGDSFSVQLSKDGPIHSVSWSPKGSDFVVVYGYMPAKATLFNLKCDPIFDFGEAARNSIYFNDFGNLLLLGGFGNLRGYVEIWDMNKKTQISTLQAPDSTLLEWSPTGEVFLTATTAPRLRIGNGFKVWHYSGALLHETSWQEGQELLDITWQKYNEGTFKEKPISNEKIEGIRSIQPEASKQVYEPPSIRLMKEGKLPPEEMTASTPPGYPTQKSSSNSNRQRKQRRPKDKSSSDNYNKTKPAAATANNTKNTDNQQKSPNATKKAENSNDTKDKSSVTTNHQQPHPHSNQQQKNDQNPHHYGHNRINSRYPQQRTFRNTGDPEKDKKIRNISRKLQDISKLKSKMNKGEHLEANQLSKIANEASLMEELKALKVSA